ncbi:cysteine desulfurase DndA [Roseimaritima ulvae]|uniref:cysteine desulfurase n=1 Tax=Roseimaritima ulvae TaxID=980254 RepID=A0A5B9QMN2_9BACT|nr:cysteine desulfurase DndA [Roseimaritima ulvae]QEG39339.1 Cysteine desulfurase [Roseimaritima ulvae]
MPPVYLDYNATTPLDPRVFEVMKEWYLGPPANAGSRTHVYGQRAKEAVEKARAQVASVIDAKPEEIVFTSGATESNNIAILGLAAYGERTDRKHIISTAIEHKAVLEPLEHLASRGFDVELAPVTSGGYVDPDEIRKRLRKDTLLVSVMHANNETGILQPVVKIGELVSESDAYFHVDAAQSFGKEIHELREVEADLISVSSHKIFGPQGTGALCVKRDRKARIPISPLLFGGGQERGLRPGTLPVPIIVGFGEASRIATIEGIKRAESSLAVRSELLAKLKSIDHTFNGDQARCQRHIVNLRFPGVDGEALMMAIRGSMALSNGSACTSDRYAPSHVLIAMGLSDDEANESVRLSWGPELSAIDADLLIRAAQKMAINL